MEADLSAETFLAVPQWNDILATNLSPPRLSGSTIARRRLLDRLNQLSASPIVVVTAPAGYGKTTLLAQWRQQPESRGAWVSVDGNERTVPQFLSTIAASLLSSMPEYAGEWRQVRESAAGRSNRPVLDALLSAASSIPVDFTLIVDDYHNIESSDIHAFMNRLAFHLPRSMHLILAGRTVPPLEIARMRAQGLLREVHAPDLRFQTDEVQAFLNAAAGVNLPLDRIREIEERTEGWIAGLQLAALSIQESEHPEALISSFAGTHPYVFEYFTDEVLRRLPATVQDFLLKTSILGFMRADICDYITGGTSGAEMLETLMRLNLFISALDGEREWYRYHSLFADLLRVRLRAVYTEDAIRQLHGRAAEWYLRNGSVAQGVEHAMAARDREIIRRLVEPVGLPLVLEFRSIRNWLAELPEEDLLEFPALGLWASWNVMTTGRYKEAGRLLSLAEAAAEPKIGKNDPLAAYILTARSRYRALCGDGEGSLRDALAAVASVSPADHLHSAAAQHSLGTAYYACGLPVSAETAFEEAWRQSRRAERLNNAASVITAAYRARALIRQGRLNHAAKVNDEAVELATQLALPRHVACFLSSGELFLQRNRLDAARGALVECISLARQRGFGIYIPAAQVLLTSAHCASGDLPSAARVLAELRDWSYDNDDRWYLTQAEEVYMRALIRSKQLEQPRRWLDRLGARDLNGDATYNEEPVLRVSAKFQIASGLLTSEFEMARRGIVLLERLRETAAASSRRIDLIWTEAALAIAHLGIGSVDAATELLESALRNAIDDQAYFPLIEDQAMYSVFETMMQRGKLRSLIGDVLEDLRSLGMRQDSDRSNVREPLSERETEILRHLASGLSTREIAEALVVSSNTVKTHVRHIYDKLDAHNRTSALAHARNLGLLD